MPCRPARPRPDTGLAAPGLRATKARPGTDATIAVPGHGRPAVGPPGPFYTPNCGGWAFTSFKLSTLHTKRLEGDGELPVDSATVTPHASVRPLLSTSPQPQPETQRAKSQKGERRGNERENVSLGKRGGQGQGERGGNRGLGIERCRGRGRTSPPTAARSTKPSGRSAGTVSRLLSSLSSS